MQPQPIGDIISKRMAHFGLQKPLEAARILAQANRFSNDRFQATSFSRGVLTVSCINSTNAQETQLVCQELIAKINQRLGHPAVKRFRFQIRDQE